MKDFRFLFEKYVLGQHSRRFPEPETLKALSRIYGDLFVDIGTNHKAYASRLRTNFKRILTIDPNPKWEADIQIALSNFNGRAMFYINDNEGSADSLIKNPNILGKDYVNNAAFTVDVRRYDDLQLGIADLVKIDVEKAEFLVLEGMEESLEGRQIKRIVVELHDNDRRGELEMLLEKYGFDAHWLDRDRLFGEQESMVIGYST